MAGPLPWCPLACPQAPYTILSPDKLKEQRLATIERVTSVLGIPDDWAVRVLRKYKWCVGPSASTTLDFLLMCLKSGTGAFRVQHVHEPSLPSPGLPCAGRDVNRVHEEWFSDMEAVQKSVGILDTPNPEPPGDEVGHPRRRQGMRSTGHSMTGRCTRVQLHVYTCARESRQTIMNPP